MFDLWSGASAALKTNTMMHLALALSLIAVVSATPPPLSTLRLNEVYMTGSHNSYLRMESLHDQLNYARVRSIELDASTGAPGPPSGTAVQGPLKPGDDPVCKTYNPIDGDWYVYHVCIVDTFSRFSRLSDGFRSVMSWHNANPQHEVITLFMDMKDGLDTAEHSPEALDALMTRIFGDALYTPADLLAHGSGSSTLVQAVSSSWPTLVSLRGKVIVILTDGQDTYATTDAVANARKAFVAKSSATELSDKGFHVFYNQDGTNAEQAAFSAVVHAKGFVSRNYYSNDYGINDANWARSVANKANFIAHNLLNFHQYQRFFTFSMTTGYPFAIHDDATGTLLAGQDIELQNILAIRASTGALTLSADSCVFLSTGGKHGDWTAEVSTANFMMPRSAARGGLMVREDTTPGSRYFAVMRLVQDHKLRVQFRTKRDGPTYVVVAGTILPVGTAQVTADFIRLSCERKNRDTLCSAYGSFDGDTWTQIGAEQRFKGVNLRLGGPFVSSTGPVLMQDGNSGVDPLKTQTKLVFTNLAQAGAIKRSSDLKLHKIGTVYLEPVVTDAIF